METFLTSLIQSAIGLALGMAVALAWRLYHRTEGAVRAYVIGSASLLLYGMVFFVLSKNAQNLGWLQLVSLVIIIWTLAGANWYLNKEFTYGKRVSQR